MVEITIIEEKMFDGKVNFLYEVNGFKQLSDRCKKEIIELLKES